VLGVAQSERILQAGFLTMTRTAILLAFARDSAREWSENHAASALDAVMRSLFSEITPNDRLASQSLPRTPAAAIRQAGATLTESEAATSSSDFVRTAPPRAA
jgi:hypothetical protein